MGAKEKHVKEQERTKVRTFWKMLLEGTERGASQEGMRRERGVGLYSVIKGKGNENVKPEGRPTMQNAWRVS